MQQTQAAPQATLDAVLERITYADEETGYTVARVGTNRSSDLLTVVGAQLGHSPGSACACGAAGPAIYRAAASSRSTPMAPCRRRPFRGSAATSARD